jgi:hypothetical protein
MTWVDKVQEEIDYIEVNLLDEMTIESVGKTINYTPSSF